MTELTKKLFQKKEFFNSNKKKKKKLFNNNNINLPPNINMTNPYCEKVYCQMKRAHWLCAVVQL